MSVNNQTFVYDYDYVPVADFQIPSFFSFGYSCRTLKAPNTRKFLEVHKQNTTEKNNSLQIPCATQKWVAG